MLNYPGKGDGRDVRKGECLGEGDERVGWEVGHLPGVGAYGLDCWRIFCRDELRGGGDVVLLQNVPEEAASGDGVAAAGEEMGEWTRVLPLDKELRAYLRWRWLRVGWVWDPLRGGKRKAEGWELVEAGKGGVMVEGEEGEGDGVDGIGEGVDADAEGKEPSSKPPEKQGEKLKPEAEVA